MSAWINGRRGAAIDYRDRGLHYGDGLFETMRVRHGAVRLLDYHLERLFVGCERLMMGPPNARLLRRELEQIAATRSSGVLKLIVTRGVATRGYRPTGREKCTRIAALYPLPRTAALRIPRALSVRLCAMRLGSNSRLAGLKTLNRLESVLARAEWRDARIGEGLLLDSEENIVCGTMSNLFIRRGSLLMTPMLDRCGIAGVMRRWVLEQSSALSVRAIERRLRWEDLARAEEVFMCNAVAGVMSVGQISRRGELLRPLQTDAAVQLRSRLAAL